MVDHINEKLNEVIFTHGLADATQEAKLDDTFVFEPPLDASLEGSLAETSVFTGLTKFVGQKDQKDQKTNMESSVSEIDLMILNTNVSQ